VIAISNDNDLLAPSNHSISCDVIGEFRVPVEPQNRTHSSANGTKWVEIIKLKWVLHLSRHCTNVTERHWGTLYQKRQIQDYQNKDRLSIAQTQQRNFQLDPTKPSTMGRMQGRNQRLILGRAIFMKFHSITSSCLFNRGTNFSQTGTYNNNVFLTQTRSP